MDEQGNPCHIPGKLKSVKGIGWYIEEYGIAQISYNLTNISIASMHETFEQTCISAESRGLRVTGSELVGLVPLQAMLNAGIHYIRKQKRSIGIPESEIIKIAVKSLGLDELAPFDPSQKIIEYKLKEGKSDPLLELSLRAFANETASESPAPGGGSISAYVGALGVSPGTMVANFLRTKEGGTTDGTNSLIGPNGEWLCKSACLNWWMRIRGPSTGSWLPLACQSQAKRRKKYGPRRSIRRPRRPLRFLSL